MTPKTTWYFKNEYFGDDWQEFDGVAFDHDGVASEVAENYWREDPFDPEDLDFKISVRKGEDGQIKHFTVSAWTDAVFCAREVEQ